MFSWVIDHYILKMNFPGVDFDTHRAQEEGPPECKCNFPFMMCNISTLWGDLIFFGRGSQTYKKSASIKLWPLYFGNKNFITPHHQYTLPPQVEIILKSVFLNKINTLSVLWSSCDSLHFGHQKFMTPLFFFPKCMTPVYSIFGTPIPKKMIALLGSKNLNYCF